MWVRPCEYLHTSAWEGGPDQVPGSSWCSRHPCVCSLQQAGVQWVWSQAQAQICTRYLHKMGTEEASPLQRNGGKDLRQPAGQMLKPGHPLPELWGHREFKGVHRPGGKRNQHKLLPQECAVPMLCRFMIQSALLNPPTAGSSLGNTHAWTASPGVSTV